MNTYEKCRRIRKAIVNRAAEVIAYDNWAADFAARQIREVPDVLRQEPELTGIQPCELTSEQCDELGFGTWSEDNPMRLIPLWLFPFLADEITTTCISGSVVHRREDMDNDVRFGCIAYGVTAKGA